MRWPAKKYLIILVSTSLIALTIAAFSVYRVRSSAPTAESDDLRIWSFPDPNLGDTDDKLNEVFDRLVANTTYVQPEDQWGDASNDVIKNSQHTIEIKDNDGNDEIWVDGENTFQEFERIFRHRCCAQFAPFPTLTDDERFIFVNYTLYSAELVELNLRSWEAE
jgi:hypothetical protein